MPDWDDLRYFLAVAREGSTIAAARALGVNQSTVPRRLAALEQAIGSPLVERHPTGYRLTALGRELVAHAERIEAEVHALEGRIEAFKRDVRGVLRLTCPEPLVFLLRQSGLLERFTARHPDVAVEFVMSDRYLDLSKGEADVALRSGDTDAGELVGHRIADSVWAVYASRRYVDAHGAPATIAQLREHRLVGLDERIAQHRVAQWLRDVAPDAAIVSRNDSVLGLLYAVKAGLGVGPLPTALADAEPELVRVLGPVPALARIWRVLAHPNLRHTPAVAAFFAFVDDEREALQRILA